jgi:NTP pyrophosphatase (non-canonical NTP hydrolase)
MELKNEFNPIREWAKDKGIYAKGDIKTQYVKFQEEAGELAKAIINNDSDEIIDAIGDCVVVLTSIAYFNNITIEECINSAYDVISKRKGNMINGSFVKQDK